jgi:flagellar hook-associated protein 3 FlgL
VDAELSPLIVTTPYRLHVYCSSPQTLASNLTGVDVAAAVTAQLSADQAQLSPSYSALAKIESLNLASYLK